MYPHHRQNICQWLLQACLWKFQQCNLITLIKFLWNSLCAALNCLVILWALHIIMGWGVRLCNTDKTSECAQLRYFVCTTEVSLCVCQTIWLTSLWTVRVANHATMWKDNSSWFFSRSHSQVAIVTQRDCPHSRWKKILRIFGCPHKICNSAGKILDKSSRSDTKLWMYSWV